MWWCVGLALASASPEPDSVAWNSEGVERFIEALAQADAGVPLKRALKQTYLKPGTDAQRWFLRYGNAAGAGVLARCVKRYRGLYGRLPEQLEAARASTPAIVESYQALEAAYPDTVFPEVHLHVGCFDSGGTATDHGLHIGFEHFTRPDPFPERLEDTRWSWALHPIERLPWMVVHELAHYQQVSHGDTLLHQALIEGGAEFVALQFAGGVVTPNMDWGLAHEAEVWEAFAAQMHGPAHIGRWFYTDTGTDWPRDLGYFVGFRIAQAYWAQAGDKSQAMVDLIRLEDVDRILADSGYDGAPAPQGSGPAPGGHAAP